MPQILATSSVAPRKFQQRRTTRSLLISTAAALALSSLGGCASQPELKPVPADNFDQETAVQVNDTLAKAATRTSKAVETLAMIERARTEPRAAPVNELKLPLALRQPTTVSWSGRADKLVQNLATSAGYQFKTTGHSTPIPVMVQIDAKQQPLAKVFEDIGLQTFPYASVVVDPNTQRVEFRYENTRSADLARAGMTDGGEFVDNGGGFVGGDNGVPKAPEITK